MKLLIVDDEELTRSGLISSIDLNSLGIHEVLQADDGIHGLEAARIHHPEIILCDVRMPRMDGITMLERLEKLLPDSVPIFMSGYSDKEYLKAAIRLKAVNYIEKPLNPAEVTEAIREAAGTYARKLHSRRGETIESMETASRLALMLTLPTAPEPHVIRKLSGELGFSINSTTSVLSFIIKTDAFPGLSRLEEFQKSFSGFLAGQRISFIYTDKKHQNLICFLFSENPISSRMSARIRDFLLKQLLVLGRFSAAMGEVVSGAGRAYQSYASAVILLQCSFFFPENTILTPEITNKPDSTREFPFQSPEAAFTEALENADREEAARELHSFREYFTQNTRLFQNSVKDFYYKLFLVLEDAEKHLQIPQKCDSATIADTIDRCFTFEELHQALKQRTEDFFEASGNMPLENPTIHMIKSYISRNYMNDTLSVKDISEHVFLSTSYVCTFFKNETGHTLNQYLTEYRMEKAKQLLRDARYKIADISSRVGYSDGNYFGKSFKKFCGLSPSEYREQNLK